MVRRGLVVLVVAVTLSALFAGGAWLGYRGALVRIAEQADANLNLAADRLQLQIGGYRPLPGLLARDPLIRNTLETPAQSLIDFTNKHLQQIADRSGASVIYLLDRTGKTIASSNWDTDTSFVGENYAFRPYFRQAVLGSLGRYHAVGTLTGRRGFFYAHPVRNGSQKPLGVIAMKLDLDRLERQWLGDNAVVFFSDENDVVMLANRERLILRRLGSPTLITEPLKYGSTLPENLPPFDRLNRFGLELWDGLDLPAIPNTALHASRDLPTLGFRANVLSDAEPAWNEALLRGGLATAAGALFWLVAAVLWQRRTALQRQLSTEEAARNLLETKVAERTESLRTTNSRLEAEVRDRAAAETALRKVQAQLVQAGKLKALGEMSAGISHELNQPLAAIQSLSDNAEILMDRGETRTVRRNLSRISEIAARMARIIRNLRAFARNEGEPAGEVDLVETVDDALALIEARATSAEVAIRWNPPAGAVIVKGGRVRLQQVILNLVANAIDAQANQTDARWIAIDLEETPEAARLTIHDNGPGLVEPERIFDPFFTTKEVGEGMGLGLSISYGIIQSFGGDITGRNVSDGGALFTITLPATKQSLVA